LPNLKITIEYDGSNYSGWQYQLNANSIQQEIEKAIFDFSGEKVNIFGAGRTDAGVHALGQIANFKLENKRDTYQILHGINFHLANDNIKIVNVEIAPEKFHSRYDAQKKTYLYRIYNREVPSAIEHKYSLHINKNLNISLMEKAAESLIGSYDFSSFRAHGCQAKSPVKTLERLEFFKNKEIISIEFEAKSFLYQQIRIMVGSLIEVGLSRKNTEWIKEVLEKKDRKLSGQTALPKGLFLKEIKY
tara:strand:+ start:802 stop:1539 length:738 start_codon:yes stop_codon:yes gene_type:complete